MSWITIFQWIVDRGGKTWCFVKAGHTGSHVQVRRCVCCNYWFFGSGWTVGHLISSGTFASDPAGEVHNAISETLTLRETRLLSVLQAVGGAPLPSADLAAASGVEEPEADLVTLRNDGILQNASPTYRLSTATAEQLGVAAARTSTIKGLTGWCQEQSDAMAIASAGPAITTAMCGAIHDHANEAGNSLVAPSMQDYRFRVAGACGKTSSNKSGELQ